MKLQSDTESYREVDRSQHCICWKL